MPEEPRVQVVGLRKVFGNVRRGGGGGTVAVNGVSFFILPGEIYGLVGGSGAGKSTVARLILRLLPATTGQVQVDGREILGLGARDLRRLRRRIQMVAQDPFQALHPGMSVRELVAEPLEIHRVGARRGRTKLVTHALEEVALSPAARFLDRYAHDLSGGQLQRVAIARAMVLEPSLLVADEPTSMLDASVQLEILNVLRALRDAKRLSALLITHDLAVARYACNRVGVMRAGEIVEEGPVEQLIAEPRHPYTRALLKASEE
jgi:peptide/nickel transport system ATP-binding protein